MPPFHRTVGGRMVGGGEADLDVEGGHDVLVEVGDKRVAVVGGGLGRQREQGQPMV